MNDEFRHERLKLPGGFMRLLQIQGNTSGGGGSGGSNTSTGTANINRSSNINNSSSSQKDIISLRITQYAIHRLPQYVAISYTWGSALATRPIRVNGRPFHVRLNLWHLLWHLRQRGESRFLWIDALCIDQKNLEERNFHVQLMGNIYDKAFTAIVWLGLPSDDRRQARVLEFIGEMAAFGRGKRGGARGGGGGIVSIDDGDAVIKFRQHFLTDVFAQRWANLLELCRGTYWTRTWIIQEFLQASHIQVLCGTASLEWVCFEDVVRMMRNVVTASQQQQQQQQQAPAVPGFVTQFMQTLPVRLTTRRIFHTSSTLEELISEFYDSRCAERRDKIYGILGIADDCGDKLEPPDDTVVHRGPRPDYSKHIVDVYFEVCDYLLSPANPGHSTLQAIYLTQRSLDLTENDLRSYVDHLAQRQKRDAASVADFETRRLQSTIPLRPDYINVISEVLPGWTSMRDLRQRLEQVDWARYVGHDVKRKPLPGRLSSSGSSPGSNSGLTPTMTMTTTALSSPSRRKSSFNTTLAEPASTTPTGSGSGSRSGATTPTGRPVRAPLPHDMIDNVVYMAEHATDTLHRLYNYSNYHNPSSSSSSSTSSGSNKTDSIPLPHIQQTPHEKRAHQNTALLKPSIIIEATSSPSSSRDHHPQHPQGGVVDPVRIGFACTDARAGDLICQFHGLLQTLVLRRADTSTGVKLRLVGTARMVTHAALGGEKRDGSVGEELLWSGCVLPPPSPPPPPPPQPSSSSSSASVVVNADVVLGVEVLSLGVGTGVGAHSGGGLDNEENRTSTAGTATAAANAAVGVSVIGSTPGIGTDTGHTDLSHYTVDMDPVSWWEVLR